MTTDLSFSATAVRAVSDQLIDEMDLPEDYSSGDDFDDDSDYPADN
jgi:hypothetical protein